MISQAVVSVSQKVARFRLALHIVQLLRQHQVVLVIRHCLLESAARGQTIGEIQQGARLASRVLQFARYSEVSPVVPQRRLVALNSLIRNRQISVRASFRATIVNLSEIIDASYPLRENFINDNNNEIFSLERLLTSLLIVSSCL